MSSEWPTVTLRAAGVSLIDCVHKTPETASDGYPYVTIPQMVDGRIDFANARRISASDFEAWTKKARPKPWDVVLSRRCNPGETVVVAPGEEFALGQNLVLLRADGTRVLPRFLRWLTRSPEWREQVQKNLNVGAVFDSLKCVDIPNFELRLPPLREQEVIADTLGKLDDKIEHNRRTGRALEELARAIFKAWFVDFEPVKVKAAGATSFPGIPSAAFAALPKRLTDSPLGRIPEGWEVLQLSETIKLTMGQSPRSEFYNTEGRGLPFHQGVTDYGFRFPADRVYCTAEGRLAAAGDVLLSVRAPVGRINVADRQLILGRGLAGMRHLDDQQSFLLYQMLHTFAEEDAIGDGTIYKAVNKDFLSAMTLLSPPLLFRQAFEAIARPLDELITAGEKESSKLAALRDYLLPRLLSGTVRVRPTQAEG